MILDDEWLVRDLLELDKELKWQVVGVNEVCSLLLVAEKDENTLMYHGSRLGNKWLVLLAIEREANACIGLQEACLAGNRDLAELMIERGAKSVNGGLGSACLGGHRDLVHLMIEKGAYRWNWGLQGACMGGHRDLAELMLDEGAYLVNPGLSEACLKGHQEVVKLMLDNGAVACFNEDCPGHEFLN
jgi:hypothetical protein